MELITTRLVKTSDVGFHGNLFGGKLAAWMDEAGAAFAAQVCDTPRVVTVLMEELVFNKPVRPNQLIKIYATIDVIGNKSITIKLEARKHNVHDGRQSNVCTTRLKFVRINDDGEAVPVKRKKIAKKYNITLDK